MVPTPIARRFVLTIPVADWGSSHSYAHGLKVNQGQPTEMSAIVGTCVIEAVWVIDNNITPVAHPEIPSVVSVVNPAVSAGYVELLPEDNSATYTALGITPVSYKVQIYVQLEYAIVFGEMLQSADPTPIGPPMWTYSSGVGPTPSPTVVSETTWGLSPNAGTASTYSKGDHTHGTPALPGGVTYACDSGVAVGEVVYISASGTVDEASAASATLTEDAIGVVLSKPSSTSAVVISTGEIDGFAGLTPGAVYFLSDTVLGGITTTAPSAAGCKIQKIGIAATTTKLYVHVDATTTMI